MVTHLSGYVPQLVPAQQLDVAEKPVLLGGLVQAAQEAPVVAQYRQHAGRSLDITHVGVELQCVHDYVAGVPQGPLRGVGHVQQARALVVDHERLSFVVDVRGIVVARKLLCRRRPVQNLVPDVESFVG